MGGKFTARRGHVPALWRQSAVTAAIACAFAAGEAQANGEGPAVVAGQASFSTAGSSLNITNSPGAIIHWQGFSIGAGETTRFIQQSAASSVLNRVIGPDPSVILGTLASNGRVFLINPSGILVGQGARIDVAGLVASTLNLSNQDFLAGRLNFAPNPLAGKVENRGTITTPSGGSVYLVGSSVTNSGIINGPQGDVILAAGQSVKIFDSSTPGVRVEVTAGDNAAANLGEILAQSGQVGIYAAVLRNTGIIDADQVVRSPSGKIVLRAKQDVTLEAGSRLSASGEQAGEITVQSETGTTLVSGTIEAVGTGELAGKGGTVQLLGNRVGLITASVDASGTTGGGTVLIGGNFHGAGPEQNAFATSIGANSSINADAIDSGNGGRIAVWSDGDTSVAGILTARGGANSGDGGFIETSGTHLSIADSTRVDTLAPHGKPGMWLLDPTDFTIAASGGDMSGSLLGTSLGDGNVSILSSNGGVEGAGDIHVNDAVTWGAATTLTLGAERDVNVNAAITAIDGSLVANAGRDVNVNAATKTTTGSLTSNAGNDVNMAAAMTVVTGNLTSNAGNDVNVTAAMTVTTGNIVLRADNDGTGPGVAGGTVFITGIGGLTITTGEASLRFNPAGYGATGAEITNYASKLTGGGTLDAKAWVFAQGDNKTYDGSNAATLSFKGTPTDGGDVTLIDPGSGATFSDKNAGVGKTVTYSGFTIGGADVAKFSLFGDGSGTTTADITPKALTAVNLIGTVTKSYDGDNTVTNLTTANYSITGFLAGEGATVGATTGTYDNGKNVVANPANSPVRSATLAADDYTQGTGTLLTNYDLTAVTGVSATGNIGEITPAPLTATVANQTKTYGSDDPLLAGIGVTLSGLVLDDSALTSTVTALTRAVGENVASSPYSITAGTFTTPSTNYSTPSLVAGSTLAITTAPLTATVANQTKTYGADDPLLAGIGVTLGGLVNDAAIVTWNGTVGVDDSALTSTATALTRAVGEKVASSPYSITAGTFTTPSMNYSAPSFTGAPTLTVTTRTLDLAATRNYDGTANFASGAFTPTITGTVESTSWVDWNGNTTAVVGAQTLTIAPGGTGTVPSRNAGPTQTLATGTIALADGGNGGLASNYTLTGGTHNGTIAQKPLTAVDLVGKVTKIYDGEATVSNLTTGNYSITGFVTGEGATIGLSTGTYDNGKDVVNNPAGSPVSSAGLAPGDYTATGTTLLSNYDLAAVTGVSATGNIGAITALGITGSITAANKVYDANTSATITSRTLAGVLGTDAVSYSGGSATFSDKNAATGETVTGTGLSLTGADAGNYTVNSTATTQADITRAPLGIAANSTSKTYGSTVSFTGTEFTSTGLKNAETVGSVSLTSSGAAATAGVAGSPYAITASAATGGTFSAGNYTITYVDGALGVTPAPLGIVANSASRLYGDANPAFSATYTGFQNGETPAALTGALALTTPAVASSNVGNYAITPSGQSSANYTIAYVDGALGVTPAPLGIAANSASKTYGDTVSFTGTEFSSTGLKNAETIGRVSLASAGAAATAGVAGSPYAITASAATGGTFNPGNYTISYVDGALGVTPAPLGIAANSTSKTFGSTVSFAGTEFTSTGLKNAETIGSVSLASAGAAVDAGVAGSPYAITASAATGGSFNAGNYTITYVDGALGVIPAELLGIAANSAAKTYDGLAFSGGNGVSYTGFRAGDTPASLNGTLAYGGSSQGAVNVGIYTIAPFGQSSPNYTITYVSGSLRVIPAALGIAANSATRLYGDANPAFSATYSGFRNGETTAVLTGALALATTAVPTSNVGNYAITPSGQSSTNYTITYVNGTLGVTPAPLGIAANSTTKTYGSTVSFAGTEFTSTGLRNAETIGSVSLASAGATATAGAAGSPYDTTASAATGGSFNPGNYAISYVDGALGVTRAPLGIAANSATRLYGDANPAFSATYSGFQNGENFAVLTGTLALATPAVASSNVGNYTITPSGQSSSNYTITYVNGALGVMPAPLLVTAEAKTKVYGTSDPALTFGVTGLVLADTPRSVLSGALTRAGGETVLGGPYAITQGTLAANSNYTLSSFTGSTLAITPAALAVAADAQSKVYGTSDPAMTFATTGPVNNPALGIADTAGSVLSGALTRASGETVLGGPYAITQGTLAANSNYALSSFTGNTLAITPAALSVVANPQNKLFGTGDPALTFSVAGLVDNPALGIADTAGSVLSGALARVPGESALGGPYAISQGSLAANSNYILGFTPSHLVITGAAAEPVLGFNAGQVIFAGVINNEFYYRPGDFWHISLNPNNADPGFDVMRGTDALSSSARSPGCDSVFGGGFCETWSFPQQVERP